MPNKRPYTLSEAARTQRRLASQSAQAKRGGKPLRVHGLITGIDPSLLPAGHIATVADIFAPLPKDAPNSEHQSRAARIRMHMLKTGKLSGKSRGGRGQVSRPCPRCNVECDTARGARDHCRKPRQTISK